MATILVAIMARLPARIVHPFYFYFKAIVQRRSTFGYRLTRSSENIALFLLIIRILHLQLITYLESPQLNLDPLGHHLFVNRHYYDGYLLSSLASLVFCTLLINCKLFLSVPTENNSWQSVAYDLTVKNIDLAEQCQISAGKLTFRRHQLANEYQGKCDLLKYTFLRPLYSLLAYLYTNLMLDNLDKSKFSQTKLPLLTFLSASLRERLLQVQILADCASGLFKSSILPFFFLGFTAHLLLSIYESFPLSSFGILPLTLFLFDLILSWTLELLVYRNFFLLTDYLIITLFAYRMHLKTGHSMLHYLSRKHSLAPRNQTTVSPWHSLLLKNFLLEHTRICQLIDASNRQLLSLVNFVSIFCNALTHIYFLYRLLYRTLPWVEIGVSLLFILGQPVFLAVILVPMAQCNGILTKTAAYIPGIQFNALRDPKSLPLKLKYETLHASLTSGRLKSGITIGPVCLLTFESLYKLISLYSIYLLCFFTLLPKK